MATDVKWADGQAILTDTVVRWSDGGIYEYYEEPEPPAGGLLIAVAGAWKQVAALYVLVSGAWKEVTTGNIKILVSGAWKDV
jgi:hypothetical protein